MTKRRIDIEVAHEDVQAFRAAVSDVKPLVHTPAPAGLAPSPRRASSARHTTPGDTGLAGGMMTLSPAATPHPARGGSVPLDEATVRGEESLEFRRPGVRDQVLRRLKRGRYPIEGELDLHGLNQAAARELLAGYLKAQRESGRRCIRVIHGKGYRSGARGPVLKSAVNEWLRHHPDVMAFVSARPLDGGTGAVYVLLRA